MIDVIVALTILLSHKGYSQQEIVCSINLVKAESGFRVNVRNPKSNAYGLFQLMNVKNNLNINDQVIRFDKYIKSRYSGSICKALFHHKNNNWY